MPFDTGLHGGGIPAPAIIRRGSRPYQPRPRSAGRQEGPLRIKIQALKVSENPNLINTPIYRGVRTHRRVNEPLQRFLGLLPNLPRLHRVNVLKWRDDKLLKTVDSI